MKQFLLPLTEPVGAVWALTLIGTVWLVIRRKWQGAVLLGLPTVLLFLLGSTPLVENLVDTEERQWERFTVHGPRSTVNGSPSTADGLTTEGSGTKLQVPSREAGGTIGPSNGVAVGSSNRLTAAPSDRLTNSPPNRSTGQPSQDAPAADVVVVLGGGERMSDLDAYGFAATDAFSRILTGIELVRKGRARDLVLGGSYPMPGRPLEPGMIAIQNWIQAWGLSERGTPHPDPLPSEGRGGSVRTPLVVGSGGSVGSEGGKEATPHPDPLPSEGRGGSVRTALVVGSGGSVGSKEGKEATPHPDPLPSEGRGGSVRTALVAGSGELLAPIHADTRVCEVTNLGICVNTHDEAVAFKKLKRFKDWNSIILVTSALHMRRSVALFERLGMHVQPVASDFEVCGVSQDLPFSIFPRESRFRLWGLYLHEKIGMIVYRRNGWIGN